jgi:TusA-related sulfurtransferase
MMDIDIAMTLDVRNELPPTPTIKFSIVTEVLDKGSVLEVIVGNEASCKNIKNLVKSKNLELVHHVKQSTDYFLYVRKNHEN